MESRYTPQEGANHAIKCIGKGLNGCSKKTGSLGLAVVRPQMGDIKRIQRRIYRAIESHYQRHGYKALKVELYEGDPHVRF